MSQIHRDWHAARTRPADARGAHPEHDVRPDAPEPQRSADEPAASRVAPAPTPAAPMAPSTSPADAERGAPGGNESPTGDAGVIEALRQRRLTLPVAGVEAGALVRSFDQARGSRTHEALDIMAPEGTPVLAVEDGTIARLFTSDAGGLTIYQFDPSGTLAYYYAHLQRYAPGLEEGAPVRRGQQIGTVGTTGNAAPDAPHLHFAIFRLGPERRWWEGTPVDPYDVLR